MGIKIKLIKNLLITLVVISLVIPQVIIGAAGSPVLAAENAIYIDADTSGDEGSFTTLGMSEIIYVDADASGGNTGTSWTDAYTDMQSALNAATSGHEIWVAEGTYKPSVEIGGTGDRYKSFQMKNRVGIYGGFAGEETSCEERDWEANVTVLSGDIGIEGDNSDNCYHVFYHPLGMDLDSTILDGFTISGGNANGDDEHNRGGGMYNYNSSPIVMNCTFSGNSASYGGGMYNGDSLPMVTNCTFSGNSASYGGGMYNYNSWPIVTNCTFSGNSADSGGGMYNDDSSPIVTNCILWGDSPDEIFVDDESLSIVIYSDVEGGYNGPGNINADPAFVDGVGGDFHLQVTSPCINVGSNAALLGDFADLDGDGDTEEPIPYDFEGDPRIFGNNVDMGVDEALYVVPQVSTDPATDVTISSATLNGTVDDLGGESSVEVSFVYGLSEGGLYPYETSVQTVSETGSFSQEVTGLLGGGATYYFRAKAVGNVTAFGDEESFTTDADTSGDEESFTTLGMSEVIYVDADATGGNTGTSWTDAYTDMQSALNAATSGHEIWVASGTYTPGQYRNSKFRMKNEVGIYGGFASGETSRDERDWETNVTVLSGDIGTEGDISDNCYHVFYHQFGPFGTLDDTAILDGFTISGGNANGGSAPSNQGGGMYNRYSSPTVTNCTFSGNSASYGGGMYNYNSWPMVTNCTFSGNSGSVYSGGMYNYSHSSPKVTNCTFYGNEAGGGGGMYNYYRSSPIVTNCTFSGNSAEAGGGMYNRYSSPTVTNCTFSGNSASYGGGMYNYSTSYRSTPIIVTNCTFYGNESGGGGGMYNESSSPVVRNCILWGDSPDEIFVSFSYPFVTYSDVEGGYSGTGNIDEDPAFVDGPGGDFHLKVTSPCINTGSNAILPADIADLDGDGDTEEPIPYDFEGDPRVFVINVDMGVDEVLYDTPQVSTNPATDVTISSATLNGMVDDLGGESSVEVSFIYGIREGGSYPYETSAQTVSETGSFSQEVTDLLGGGATYYFRIKAVGQATGYGNEESFITPNVSQVIYVDADVTGGNTGTSWEDALTDLKDALAAAGPGDEIWVASGTYTSGLDRTSHFQMENEVGIYGGFVGGETSREERDWETNVTVLSGDIGIEGYISDNCYHVFYHPSETDLDDTAILDGFTISGGNANGGPPTEEFHPNDNGGGMYNEGSSPTVMNCTFYGNSADRDGGGMYNKQSSPMVTNCTFYGNSASSGGGMYNPESSPMVTNCTFSGNNASYAGGGMSNYRSWPMVTNCTFYGNSASSGGGMYNSYQSSPMVTNCTFYGNSARSGGGMYNSKASPIVTNCILWGDSPDEIFVSSSYPVVTYSDIEGGYSGTGNMDEDPAFVDGPGGDFHLQVTSPCINTGSNAALPADIADLDGDGDTEEPIPYDFEGDPRISESTVDMGVDEMLQVSTNPATDVTISSATLNGMVVGLGGESSVEVSFVYGLSEGGLYPYETSVQTMSGTGSFSQEVTDLIDGVTYYFRAKAVGNVTAFGDEESFTTLGVSEIIYVDADVTGGNTGTSWEDALTDLQDALTAAGLGDEIWVASGTYTPGLDRTSHFQMENEVGIYGGFAGGETSREERDWETNVTVLSGDIGIEGDISDNCYHVFYHPSGTDLDDTAILDGFTISGGNANGGPPDEVFDPNNNGGGMYNESSSPTVMNCTFSGSSASVFGGGMYNSYQSSPMVTNCTFYGNNAYFAGGGMFNYHDSSPIVTNCTFYENSAGEVGGGMLNVDNSSPRVTNCTFYENSAREVGAGMFNSDSSPVVTNCILWGDSPDEIINEESSPVVTYSDVEGGYSGTGNIDEDPAFVDGPGGDFHLQVTSPCINVGSNAALPADIADLDGDGDTEEPIPYDFEGDPRISESTVDMGVDEVSVQPPCILKVIQLDALNDFDIADISDPIWTKATPSQYDPIADGMKNRILFWPYSGSFKIKATIEAYPSTPSWEPKCAYSWSIPGTDKQGSGDFTGWDGEFVVRMPQEVREYTLNLDFSLYDDEGNKVNSQSMIHTLYATYENSKLQDPPKVRWLEKATYWAVNATNPSEVAFKLNQGIYNDSKWKYRDNYYPSIWIDLIEGTRLEGNCWAFTDVWVYLNRILGVDVELAAPPDLVNWIPGGIRGEYGKGFVTKTNSIALAPESIPGNAHPPGQDVDRWSFDMHQFGKRGFWIWTKFYDPTFGKVYDDKNEFIEWDQVTDWYWMFVDSIPQRWADLTDGHKIRDLFKYLYLNDTNTGWREHEYHSSSNSSDPNSDPSYGAVFTGNYTIYGVDSDGDGIYNSLAIDAEVDVSTAGDYSVVGFLKSDDTGITSRRSIYSTIPLGHVLSVLEPGLETITLTFSGGDIYNSGIDGIYTADLAISDENGFVIDYQSFDTSAFNHAEFGELPAGMEILIDYGEDTDGDGLFDYLTAEVDLHVMRAMNYILQGTLYSNDGLFITSITNTHYLENSEILELNFDGTKIHKSEKDGPYLLAISLNDENYDQIGYQEYFTSTYVYTDFQEPAQQFTGTYSDYGTDTDGDGLFNYLTIEVGIDITTPGDYTVDGHLYDSNERLIEIANTSTYLHVGTQSATLSFNGRSINRNRVDGPYYLKYLVLSDSSDQIDFIDFAVDACTTFAYSFTDFQIPPTPLSVLTGNYWDYGTDIDGDGIFDYLTVDVEAILAEPGSCAIWARLVDINEEEIVWAENIAELEADQPEIIQLNFNGEAIYSHGVDGPYYLRDVYIYHTADPTLPDYVYEAYTTSAYSYWQFGNLPPVADANGPYSGEEGSRISLTASNSTDPNGDPLEYRWDFDNDGIWDTDWLTEPSVEHTWYDDYSDLIKVKVWDGELEDTATATVNVSNVSPIIGEITAPLDPVQVGTEISISAVFSDPGTDDTHVAIWDWGDSTTSDGYIDETVRLVSGNHTYTAAGVYTINLTVTDDDSGSNEAFFHYVVVYDSGAGFVTGGGWINSPEGAYTADPTLTGKANLGFNVKYHKGDDIPTGQTQFNFKAADLKLHNTSYEWLVITGAKALFKGEGTVNGEGSYEFQITVIDADVDPNDAFEIDRFRIKIWEEIDGSEVVIYDNALGDDSDDATTEIGGGSIKIHNG